MIVVSPHVQGLDQSPSDSASYNVIDRAIYCAGGGAIEVYEAGVLKGSYGSYAAGDTFAVHYDGATVRYIRNGSVFATSAWFGAGGLHLDSSFFSPGGKVTNLRFVPLSPVADIGTDQVAAGAISEVYAWTDAAGVGYSTIT